MKSRPGFPLTSRSKAGRPVLVTGVGAATGARAAAAALACAGSEPHRAGLLIDIGEGRTPRSSLIATAAARDLEERVVVHLRDAGVASRGRFCHVTLPPDLAGIGRIPAALAVVRDSLAVVCLPPTLLRPVLEEPHIGPSAALLRADLPLDRALTALAVRDLMERGLRVAVLKRPLGWLAARAAQIGALPEGSQALPTRVRDRVLSTEDNTFHRC